MENDWFTGYSFFGLTLPHTHMHRKSPDVWEMDWVSVYKPFTYWGRLSAQIHVSFSFFRTYYWHWREITAEETDLRVLPACFTSNSTNQRRNHCWRRLLIYHVATICDPQCCPHHGWEKYVTSLVLLGMLRTVFHQQERGRSKANQSHFSCEAVKSGSCFDWCHAEDLRHVHILRKSHMSVCVSEA